MNCTYCGWQKGPSWDEVMLSSEEIKPVPLLSYAWLKVLVKISLQLVGRVWG